jgi:transposase InsO family protein
MGLGAFARTVDVAPQTLGGWKRRYEEDGPFGLEPRTPGRPRGSGAGSRLPAAVRAAVEETRRRFPIFGLKRIGQWLRRFRGIEVSPGGVKRVLAEAVPPVPVAVPPRKKARRHKVVRRFERARPGALWQTDITSFVLARHHVRVYLVVFLDDHSRYVVSWALSTSAKKDWVAGCLMDGIQRYGKPVEVLSDQGPQYYSWRGKSAFQRLLGKEGIRHVVARSHHPQTLGKVERLWKTVGEELWERVHPQELEEARERLGHYFAFYNHFRPHQGIEGGIPAERFFGAAEAVKRATAERVGRNALQLALGERPRKTAFLVGQVGDRAVSVHGEAGRLVVQTDEGVYEALGLEDLGMGRGKEAGDAATDGEGGGGRPGGDVAGDLGGPGGDPGDDDGGPDPDGPDRAGGGGDGSGGGGDGGADGDGSGSAEEAAGVLPDAASGGGGAGPVGPGDGGGAAAGARGGDGDPGVVAGGDAEGGGAREAAGDPVAPVADEPDGALGDGGGAAQAAEEEGEGAPGDSRGGEPGGAQAEGGAAGAGPALGAGAGDAAAHASPVEEGCGGPIPSPWRTGSGSGRSCGRDDTPGAGSGPCAPGRSA